MLAEALRSALVLLRLLPGAPSNSDSITTVLRSLTPAQLKDPAMVRADWAIPLPMDATDPGPLDLTESYAVLSSSSLLWAL